MNENGKTEISLTVQNIGNVDGSEIVQIYVAPVQSEKEKELRPSKELRGFEKIFLKAGESKSVSIALDENAFKVFSIQKNSFVTIGGKYKIQAGASIKDIHQEKEMEIQGEALLDNVSEISEDFYKSYYIEEHYKGTFTLSDSLGDMAKQSIYLRWIIKILSFAIVLMNKGKSKEDPAVKIAISAIVENPLESLISTSGGIFSEKLARWILKKANKK